MARCIGFRKRADDPGPRHRQWLDDADIKTLSPRQDGYVESFHKKFRRECLTREMFYTLNLALVVIGDWHHKFNFDRPHRSLKIKTPVKYAVLQ